MALLSTVDSPAAMWRGDDAPFEGRHYRLARPLNSPNSLQRPHPPILVGGSGERKTLRLVARYADACNLFDIPGSRFHGDLSHKLDVLRRHCADVGRDYDEIEKTCASTFDLGDDRREGTRRLVEHLRELAAVGIEHVLLSPTHPWDAETLDAAGAGGPRHPDERRSGARLSLTETAAGRWWSARLGIAALRASIKHVLWM